jgi:hypothetical protein
MILYLFGFIIVIIVIFFMYVRLKYKFWALQPVFHFYDVYYWFINVGVIRKELPEKNKYVNLKKITTKEFEKIDEVTKKQIVMLIRLNYLRNGENIFNPKKENIDAYFMGHNTKTFWSYFSEKEMLIDNNSGKIIEENKIIGVMTSRPLHVKINNINKDSSFDVYYVDYLCVNKDWRKKNIAPQLIQTHEYNQSNNNKNIFVSLFKREEELTGIIPLTIYKTYCFPLKNDLIQDNKLNSKIALLTCDKLNIYYLYNFINEMTKNEMTKNEMKKNEKKKWDITIYPEISNIVELIESKNLFIKMLVIGGNIESVYIFRKTCTYIENEKEILSCIGSINGNILKNEEFIKGFNMSLCSIIKDNKNFKYVTIEDISDNTCIINNICIKTHPIAISPMAYFFYNFAYNSFKSQKCLIIN